MITCRSIVMTVPFIYFFACPKSTSNNSLKRYIIWVLHVFFKSHWAGHSAAKRVESVSKCDMQRSSSTIFSFHFRFRRICYQWQQYCIWLFYSYFGQAEPLFWIKMNLLKKFIEQRVEVDRNKIRWNSPTIRPHFDTSRKSLYLWPQRFILSGRLNVTWIFVIKCYFCAQHNYHSDWPKICYFNYN